VVSAHERSTWAITRITYVAIREVLLSCHDDARSSHSVRSPYAHRGHFTDWIETLEKLKAVDFDIVLPAHGDAFKSKAKIDHWQAYLRDFWSQVQQMHKASVPAEEASRRVDLRAHAANYPAIAQTGVNVNGVLRAYELLEGKVQ